jgi:hypothetical protein
MEKLGRDFAVDDPFENRLPHTTLDRDRAPEHVHDRHYVSGTFYSVCLSRKSLPELVGAQKKPVPSGLVC